MWQKSRFCTQMDLKKSIKSIALTLNSYVLSNTFIGLNDS